MTLPEKVRGPGAGPGQEAREVKVTEMPWYHGKISREQAEKLLNPRRVGLFLVRL